MRIASSLARAALGSALVLASWCAQAGFQSNITVQLLAPGGVNSNGSIDNTPISTSQSVAVADLATGIVAGDGGNIGSGYMLTGEQIFFGDGVINIKIGVGDESSGNYLTGYLGTISETARYEFDNLDLSAGTITGFALLSSTGFASPADPASLVHLIDSHTLSFDLDTLQIAKLIAGASNNFATVSIQLLTDNGPPPPPPPPPPASGVPEPASLSLLLIGALGALRNRQRR